MALSSFDVFRKVPKDLTNRTRHGGLLSIAALGLIMLVLTLETWTYLAGETRAKIVLDDNPEAKLDVNFEVSFYELPCRFASIEMWDRLGNVRLDVSSNIEKTILSGTNAEIRKGKYEHRPVPPTKSIRRVPDAPAGAGDVIEATTREFGNILKKNDYTFVLYYVKWCQFCQMVMPIWDSLGKHIASLYPNVKVVQLDCEAEAALCQASKIPSYPTFMMYKGVNPLENEYHGERSVDAFSAYIQKIAVADPTSHALKYQWHEGCLLKGTLKVNRVPGNFHIRAKSDAHNFDQKSTNTSHIIHHLSFGPRLAPRLFYKIPPDIRLHIAPLDDTSYVNHVDFMSHEHYLKVVSTHYKTGTLLGHSDVLGYQMSSSSQQYKSDPNVPEARFSYDLSATAVVISQAGRRWYEFITSLCAIVGGTFTVFSLMDGIVHRLTRRMQVPTTPSSKLT